jgi:3-phenylpropionate/trans-cinnamate dioxygenase ferredoxin reductase subunit
MRRYTYLLLGAGLTAATAAETLRQHDLDGAIGMVGDEPYLPYYRPRLPGYVAGRIGRSTVLERPARWAERLRLDTFLGAPAVRVDVAARIVTLADGLRIGYDALLIATGARPRTLGVPGEALPGVHRMWSLADADGILADLDGVHQAVTVGGGFIGAELTESLLECGLEVTYLIRGPRWFYPYIDEPAGQLVMDELRDNGVDVRLNAEVAAIVADGGTDGRVAAVQLVDGTRLPAEIVTCSLGARFDVGFLEGSGIALSRGVLTNEWLETNVPGVWAAGDVADVYNPRVSARVKLHNTFSAGLQGRMAALGMLGRREQLLRVPQYGFRLFGLFFTFVGVQNSEAPGLESWTMSDPAERSYVRVFLHQGRFVGGLLVNSRRAGLVRRLVEEGASAPMDMAALFAARAYS